MRRKTNLSFYSFRIVRNRGNQTDHPSPPLPSTTTTTTTEDINRTSQPTDVYSIHSLLHHPSYEYSALKQRSSAIRLNGNILYSDMPLVFRGSLTGMEEKRSLCLDFPEFTREQQESLEKFFKENPWMENVSIDIIGKQTGFPESMIKVSLTIISSLIYIIIRQVYLDQIRLNRYSSANYLNYACNEFIPTSTINKTEYDTTTTSKRKKYQMKKGTEHTQTRFFFALF